MSPESFAERVVRVEQRMSELRELPKKVDDLGLQVLQLRSEMHGEFSAVRAEMRQLNEETRREMRQLNDETRRHMLVLHEEVIGRIAMLQEGLVEKPRQPRKKRRP